jgi:hypothetical protein
VLVLVAPLSRSVRSVVKRKRWVAFGHFALRDDLCPLLIEIDVEGPVHHVQSEATFAKEKIRKWFFFLLLLFLKELRTK